MNLILAISKMLVKTICSSFWLNGQVPSHSSDSGTGQRSCNEMKRSSCGIFGFEFVTLPQSPVSTKGSGFYQEIAKVCLGYGSLEQEGTGIE